MKISRQQLDELIRLITIGVLKEWSSLSSTTLDGEPTDSGKADDGVKPTDAQTSAEKSREQRLQKQQAKHDLDQAKQQKITNKEKAESGKSMYDQWRKFDKNNDEKAIKDLQMKVADRGSNPSQQI